MVLWEDSHSKKITTKMHYEKVRGKNPLTGARKNTPQKLDLDLPLELQIQDCPEFGYNQKNKFRLAIIPFKGL